MRSRGSVACRSSWAVLLALAVLLGTGKASGGGAEQTAGLKKFEEGKRAFDGGRFEEALLAFQASLEVLPSPNSRLYIARCFRAMGKTGSAYTQFRLAMREAQDRLTATGEKRYTATRDAASKEAAELEAKVPRLTVAVPSDIPESFVVMVDKEPLPKAAWGTAIEVDPGKHDVSAGRAKGRRFSQAFDIKPGEQKRVDLPRIPMGSLTFTLAQRPAGLAVELDGEALDPTTLDARRELDVGDHVVTAQAPGYRQFRWSGALADGERLTIPIEIELERTGTPRWLFYGAAALAVVGLGTGTYLAYSASSSASTEKSKDPLLRDPATRDDIRTTASRANVAFIAGGVFALAAGTLAFMTRWEARPTSEARVMVSPTVGLGSYGFAAGGRFW